MLIGRLAAMGAALAFAVGWVLHRAHADPAAAHEAAWISPAAHYLRDSALAVPLGVAALCLAAAIARPLARRWLGDPAGMAARLLWAGLGSLLYALGTAPGALLHDALFLARHDGLSFALHSLGEGLLAGRYSLALLIVFAAVWGVPWREGTMAPAARARRASGAATC